MYSIAYSFSYLYLSCSFCNQLHDMVLSRSMHAKHHAAILIYGMHVTPGAAGQSTALWDLSDC